MLYLIHWMISYINLFFYVFKELGHSLIKPPIECRIFALYSYRSLSIFFHPVLSVGAFADRKAARLVCWFLPHLTSALTLIFSLQSKTQHISAGCDILTLCCVHCTVFSGCDGEERSEWWRQDVSPQSSIPVKICSILAVIRTHSDLK